MLHAPDRGDPGPEPNGASTRAYRPRGPDRRRGNRRRVTALGTWDDAFILFDGRMRALHLWATGVRELSSNLELDWCIACLADVRSALYQLHVAATRERLAPSSVGPPVVSYLSEAYVWCGDVLDNVEALIHELSGGPSVRDTGLAQDSSAYIDEFLAPLFRRMCESARGATVATPPERALLPLAERLHGAIVSLNWVLQAA
jgi:hypothetical protein